MRREGVVSAADAVLEAKSALRRAADAVDELSDLAASSLRVLDDAATEAFYAHQEDRRDFHVESAGDHLARLRDRSALIRDRGEDLARTLTEAEGAIERAGDALPREGAGSDGDVAALRTQIEVLSEVVRLAGPMADKITRHAQRAADSATATDAVMLLDRVHHADQDVARSDEGVSMMRVVIASAQARTSAALAGPPPPSFQPVGPADPGIAI